MSARLPNHALDRFDRVLDSWPGSTSWNEAIDGTVTRHGYAATDVVAALHHTVDRSRAEVLRRVVQLEVGGPDSLTGAPSTVLVLTAATVPGLAIDATGVSLAVGARPIIRPSRDETVLGPFLHHMGHHEPELRASIELVPAGARPPWHRASGAIVFGSDQTIAHVRSQLPPGARVAGYGSRQGLAVVTDRACESAEWSMKLANDVLMFGARGCMSPSAVLVLGDERTSTRVADLLGAALAARAPHHVHEPAAGHAGTTRASADADALGAIGATLSAEPYAIVGGAQELPLTRAGSLPELGAAVGAYGMLLQTAVLACGADERVDLERVLVSAGCSRVCAPGAAHQPPATWPHDGIGRIAPLLGVPLRATHRSPVQ